MTADAPAIARVLLDTPLPQLDHLFDYRIPDELRGSVVPGVRVRVPLRMAGRIADGYVVETAATSEVPGELTPIEALVSEQPVLTPEVYALARAVADRAAGSASDVLRLAIPKRQVRVEKAWRDGRRPPEPDGVPAAPEVTGYPDGILGGPGDRVALDALPGVVAVGGQWIGAGARTLAQRAGRVGAPPRRARGPGGRRRSQRDPRGARLPRPGQGAGGSRRSCGGGRRPPPRRPAEQPRALSGLPLRARAAPVHRARQPLRGLRPAPPARPPRDL